MTFEGFEAANTTPVPDILFDELLSDLTGAELKVLLYIIRRTRGFKKDTDAISLTQLQGGITTKDGKVLDKGCGIKRRDTIVESLTSLEKKNCITIKKGNDPQGDKATTIYGIKFKEVVTKPDYPSNITGLPVVTKPDYPSPVLKPRVVTKPDSQETVIHSNSSQETEKQESVAPASLPGAKTITPTVKNFPEWMVTKAEELRKKPYTETQQAKEVTAAKKVLARKPDLTQDEFIQVFNKRNDEWWQEHVGLLNVTHLAATPKDQNDIRFMLVLEQITRQPTLFPGASNGTGATTNQRSHNLLPELQAAKVNARNYRKSAEIRRKRGDIAGAEEAEQDAIEYEAEVERLSQQEQQIA